MRDHLPDGEVHWPDEAALSWAGECWAIEAELTRKTVARTAEIMREILTRTGDYGSPAAQARVPGQPPRHARVLYLCSPAARPVVTRARDAVGGLGVRVEIRDLPAGAQLPHADQRRAGLSRTGLARADLSRAGLPHADLPHADLPGPDPPGPDPPGADSPGADSSRAGPLGPS